VARPAFSFPFVPGEGRDGDGFIRTVRFASGSTAPYAASCNFTRSAGVATHVKGASPWVDTRGPIRIERDSATGYLRLRC
jgi:hypothetical protein